MNINIVDQILKIKFNPIKAKIIKFGLDTKILKANEEFEFDIKEDKQTLDAIKTEEVMKELIFNLKKDGKTRGQIIELFQSQLNEYNFSMPALPKLVYKLWDSE